ncbi:NACHT domain-containing protein [Microtetraspora malaysiensis]|uniref:NACHT domain-containing protein n=1 Tax=Microtetraspora malaysiensis TaxID=161358 RepID=UPI003D90E83F
MPPSSNLSHQQGRRVRKLLFPVFAALLSAAGGVLVNRVEGAWWTQSVFFVAAAICFLIAGYIGISGQLPNEFPEFRARRIKKARSKLCSKILPNHVRRLWSSRISVQDVVKWSANMRYVDVRSGLRTVANLAKHGKVGDDILSGFDKSDGQLIVLGGAGSGKTHTLLILFEELVSRCSSNASESIPFYLDLSDWREGKGLRDWCIEAVHAQFGVRRDFVAEWVDGEDIVLILDGLDEMPRKLRQSCISAINVFRGTHGLLPIVVACRTEEYSSEPKELQLKGAIRLDSMDTKAVRALVEDLGNDYKELKSAVRRDKALVDLLGIPLFMSLAISVFYQTATSNTPARRSTSAWKNAIIDAYIDGAQEKAVARFPRADPGIDTWLPRLLLRVDKKHNVVFLPDRIPQSLLDEDMTAAAKRLAGWRAVVIVLVAFSVIRLPLFVFVEGSASGGYPYLLTSLILGAATAYHMRGLTVATLDHAPSGRRPAIGRHLKRVAIRWTVMYAMLGTSVVSISSVGFRKNIIIQIMYVVIVGVLAVYPAFALFNISDQGDFDEIPRQPGQETRMLLITSLMCAGITTTTLFASLSLAMGPMLAAGVDLFPAAFPVMLPYFALPFSLIAAFRHGGAEWLIRIASQRVTAQHNILPSPYWHSIFALRNSSLLTPSGGGYVVIHSLVRERLIARAEARSRA